jgi:hypothetical protein
MCRHEESYDEHDDYTKWLAGYYERTAYGKYKEWTGLNHKQGVVPGSKEDYKRTSSGIVQQS